jgi:integrase
MDPKNGTRMAPNPPKKGTGLGKADSRYWLQEGKLRKRDRSYFARIQWRGEREFFTLNTANKTEAATRAAQIYRDVAGLGWERAMTIHKPHLAKAPLGSTVGELIRAVMAAADVRPSTMARNATAFRRIAGDIAEIEAGGKSRYAPCGEGREAWLKAVDAVPLDALTPAKVQAWKLAFVARANGDELKARSARNSANSIMRQARSLFAKSLLKFLTDSVVLPSPLPFDGVELFPRQSMRYNSTMDVKALLTIAQKELTVKERREEWKALLLCLFAGLRRNEADKLRWTSIDFDAGVIRVETAGDFAAKAETSLGDVSIDPEVCAIFRGLRTLEQEAEYVLAGDVSKPNANWGHYRAAATFKRLVDWLRAHGVKSRTPLHTLRKECGSVICQNDGLFAASRFLRHADVAITAQFYAAQKDRVTVGLGGLLSDAPRKFKASPEKQAVAKKLNTKRRGRNER